MGGYHGRFLRVDLSRDKVVLDERDDSFYRKYFGGWAVIAYYLLTETKANLDPLGPDNLLIFAPGIIAGAPFSGAGRHAIGGKSPLTGGFAEADVGGYWGAELKHASLDGIVVKGKAKDPVYIWVHDSEAEILDASTLWGMDTGDCQNTIREKHGDNRIKVAGIGKGGENLVKYACIINDNRDAAGRTGTGAIMGSKNLKAVAVRGKGKTPLENPQRVRELATTLARAIAGTGVQASSGEYGGADLLHQYGTGALMDEGRDTGNLPTRNFRDGLFEAASDISAVAVKEKYRVRMDACFGCAVRCKKVVEINGKDFKVDPDYGGPEYETLGSLGSNCGVGELDIICRGNELCNRYSIDTIGTGMSISFAMECYEHGIITKEDTDGLDLSWGNGRSMLKLIELVAEREGIGALLAEGVMRASKKLGKESEKFAIYVKGQEFPMHEPRLKRALGLGYAVSATGADHMHNLHDTGISGRHLDAYRSLGLLEPVKLEDLGPNKIRIYMYHMFWRVLDNCLTCCMFIPWSYEDKRDLVRAITGWNASIFEMMKVGERAINLARIFNIREGKTSEDDWLPERMFQPQTSGPLSDTSVNPDQFRKAIGIYYGMMGWDKETGIPTKGKLDELDIEWAAGSLP